MDRKEYQREYYLRNKGRISERRKELWVNDPSQREKANERCRESRRRKAKERREAIKRGDIVLKKNDGRYVISIDGEDKKAYTIALVAGKVGRSVVSIRQLFREGFLPKSPLIVSGRTRVYTLEMIEVLRRVFDRYPRLTQDVKHKIYAHVVVSWEAIGVRVDF